MDQYKIIWTAPAEADLDEIITFLEQTRSIEIAIRFVETLYDSIDLIANMPEIGIRSFKEPSVRRKLIGRYHALYYKINPEVVYLLRLIDTRSNPTDNPF